MAKMEDLLTLAEMSGLKIAHDEPMREFADAFDIKHRITQARDDFGQTVWIGASNQALHFGGDWTRNKVEPIYDVGMVRFYASLRPYDMRAQFVEWPYSHTMRKLPWLLEI